MAAAGKAVPVLGERAGPKKERMELAETSFYSDKLDMLLRRHLGACVVKLLAITAADAAADPAVLKARAVLIRLTSWS